MIPRECKRLAEVDFPIAAVSMYAAREKTIRHGHPSTVHMWWARRPLASSRAILLALLLPDPCDSQCPIEFKNRAHELLPLVGCGIGETDAAVRHGLLKFIGDFANWDLSSQPTYLKVARGLVKSAHPEGVPLVVDPFSGGGSIPLEGLRLGCEAFASDLNPVAYLILKVMLQNIPRSGPTLVEEMRRVGAEIRRQAERELVDLYPVDADGATPIAYLWARTVRCEAPRCGAEIPLVRSFWLCKKSNRKRALRYHVVRSEGEPARVEFDIFTPSVESDVAQGTVRLGNARCLCCDTVLPKSRVRAQLTAMSFGSDMARLLAVVILRSGNGREYRLPTQRDLDAMREAQVRLCTIRGSVSDQAESDLLGEPLPKRNTRNSGFGPGLYGATRWADLFNSRQKLGLLTFAKIIRSLGSQQVASPELVEIFALAISKLAELSCACCRWEPVAECPRGVFQRQAMPISWDYAEGVLISESSGSFAVVMDNILGSLSSIGYDWSVAEPQVSDASKSPLPDECANVWFTDPPYYDSIAYADLSDFFFVWLRTVLPNHKSLKDPFNAQHRLVPKDQECIQNEEYIVDGQPKDKNFFESKLASAFAEGRRILVTEGIACVVFAHKTTEAWEALLAGLFKSGWVVTASWPITTEMASRFVARNSAALAASVHLVCRPRTEETVGDWGDVLRELPKRVAEWMERLQSEHVRGADLVFACIGPALEIYSRYSKVETAEGHHVPLGGDPTAIDPQKRGYLAYVWEAVGRAALEQVLGGDGGTAALEEDARLTALFLWTLQSSNGVVANTEDEEAEADHDELEVSTKQKAGGFRLVFDVARRFAQPLGIHLPEWDGRIIEIEKGVVRLLPVAERAKQLFGEDDTRMAAAAFERNPMTAPQMVLFPEEQTGISMVRGRGRKKGADESNGRNLEDAGGRREATTLDRIHAAMLLQRSGQTNGLRALLTAEQERGPDFLRLANALSALYPSESEEKRLLDAMLLAVPR